MDLDDMKQQWQQLSDKMDRQYANDLVQLRRQKNMRGYWFLTYAGQTAQMAAGVMLAFASAQYWIDHRDIMHLMICGLSLHIYGIAMIIAAAQDLRHARAIDFTAPLLTVQCALLRWRRLRIATALFFGVIGCFAWIPLMLVLFDVLFGADLYRQAPLVVAVFGLSGMACAAGLLGIIAYARRPGRQNLARWLTDGAIGHTLRRAAQDWDELARFARD